MAEAYTEIEREEHDISKELYSLYDRSYNDCKNND